MATTAQLIATLFGTYGQANDLTRQRIYCDVLKSLPVQILEKGILKTITEWDKTFTPPPAVIIKASKSFMGAIDSKTRVKTWDEAWAEIDARMRDTAWGKTPTWSTPQIAAAVNNYGWQDLQMCLAADMPIIKAQIRRAYEASCDRIEEQAKNDFWQGKNPRGILGIPLPLENALQGAIERHKGVAGGKQHGTN